VLRCAHAVGGDSALLNDFEIPNGERTTGWAAANQCSIMNSVAALDLGSVAEASSPPLRAALCAPVKDGSNLIGALTLYSTLEAPFADRHRYIAEQIAIFLAESMRRLHHGSVLPFSDHARGSHVRTKP